MNKEEKGIRKILRPSRIWTDCLPAAMILGAILMLFGSLIGELAEVYTPMDQFFGMLVGDEDGGTFVGMYASFFGIWLLYAAFVLIPKFNRPMIKGLAFGKGRNPVKWILIGALAGFATNGFCILMSVLMGDIKLSFNRFSPGVLFLFLIAITIQSGAEEIVCRSYLYQKLRRRYKAPWVAMFFNAVLFAIFHLANPGVTVVSILQIIVIGMIFSLFVYIYDCLWAAIAMHMTWNFTQSILFGLPNSGIVSSYSLFKLDAASAEDGFFYNVNFGVEGSIGAVLLLTVILVVLIVVAFKKGEKNDLWEGKVYSKRIRKRLEEAKAAEEVKTTEETVAAKEVVAAEETVAAEEGTGV